MSRNYGNERTVHRRITHVRLSAHPSADSIDPEKLKLLPATVEALNDDKLVKFGWKGPLEVILSGTRDKHSTLAALREHEQTIVKEIYSYISNQWAGHVKLTVPAALVGRARTGRQNFGPYMQFNHGRRGRDDWRRRTIKDDVRAISSGFDDGFVAFVRCGRNLEFPEQNGRNVNMMPFIFGDKESLPEDLQCYFPLIEQCPYGSSDVGKVGYLTVHESYVNAGESQRRGGLHIESPGFTPDVTNSSFTPGPSHCWGLGMFSGPDQYDGGIYMASSVQDTCAVWDALVDSRVPGIVDRHGGCEHLRKTIGQGTKLEAGELVWMTDQTPHEALPQKKSGYRQFFRVVTPSISHWYAEHSTENPKVPLPSNVTVVSGNKFARVTYNQFD